MDPRRSLGIGLLAGGAWALTPETALACGAICDVPEFWDVSFDAASEPVVVSNFGLIRRSAAAWTLVCEAAVSPGFVTGGVLTSRGPVVSTTEGLYRETDGWCGYSPFELGADDVWPLAFSHVETAAESVQVALVLDGDSGALEVVGRRTSGSEGDGVFETLTSFAGDSGYRSIDAFGEPARLFVTGHTFSPRVFHLAYSLDAGTSWQQRSFDFEGREHTLAPLGPDPERPDALMLGAQVPSDEPAVLWRFDAATDSLAPVFTLGARDRIAGLAVAGEHWFLAARGERDGSQPDGAQLEGVQRGGIYRAPRGSDAFERLPAALPPLRCLRSRGDALYACGDDFTRGVPWILGRSRDGGESFEPVMRLGELGRLAICSEVCELTQSWLTSVYGLLLVEGEGPESAADAGPPNEGTQGPWRDFGSDPSNARDAEAAGDAAGAPEPEVISPGVSRARSSGCAVTAGASGSGAVSRPGAARGATPEPGALLLVWSWLLCFSRARRRPAV